MNRHNIALALALLGLATGALAPAGALAQPTRDVAAVQQDHDPAIAPWSITFTNPLGRSRGPGAGAGLL